MEFQHLHVFVVIAHCKNLEEALRALEMGELEVSGAIQALEEMFGVKLVRNCCAEIELTECGCTLLSHAEKIVSDIDDAFRAVERAKFSSL